MAFKMVGTYSPSGSGMVSLIAQLKSDPFSFSLECLMPSMLCTLSTALIRQVDCDSYFPFPCLHHLVCLQQQSKTILYYVNAHPPACVAYDFLQMLCYAAGAVVTTRYAGTISVQPASYNMQSHEH